MIVFALFLLTQMGCHLPSMGNGRVSSIEANMKSLRQVGGRIANSPFTAYFQQMDLQMIEESPVEGGPVRSRYYFHQNALFYYRQYRDTQLERQFFLDRYGNVKNVVPETLSAEERKVVMARSEELNKAAYSRAGQMFVFPLMRNR